MKNSPNPSNMTLLTMLVLIGIILPLMNVLQMSFISDKFEKIERSLKYQEYMLIPEEFFFPENRDILKDINTIEEFIEFNRAIQDTSFVLYKEEISPNNSF